MKDQDHYAVPRVAPNADQATIKAAYRTRVRKCHPDLNPDLPDATRLSASLNLAYDVLCNEVKRGVYDWDRRQANRSSAGNTASSSRRPGYQRREPGEQSSEANTTRDTRSSSRQRSGYQRQQRGGRDSGANTAGSATSDSRQRSGHQQSGPGEQNSRANRTAGASSNSHQRSSYHRRQRTGRNSHSYTAGSNSTSSDGPSNEQQRRSEGQDSQTNSDGNAAYSHEQGVGNTQATSVASAIFPKLGRICRAFGVAVMLSIEILSVPSTMIGVGAVLAAFGVYMVASVAMDYVIMALLGAPAAVFGLAILICISEWRLMMLGCVVAAVGAFFAFAGVYMTVTSAPMAVMLAVVGSVTIVLAVRSGRSQNDFTSKRIHLVS